MPDQRSDLITFVMYSFGLPFFLGIDQVKIVFLSISKSFPLFENIRCFSFVNEMYLDIF
jgi:hypothetical protein